MSYLICPTLPLSLAKGLIKSPNFGGNKSGTIIQKSVGGIVASASTKPYPTWDFEFSCDYVTGNENTNSTVVSEFIGFFMGVAGRGAAFLFTDPQDHNVTAMQFGTGDGTTTAFQISRYINNVGVDVIQNVNGSPSIYDNGTLKTAGTDYSINSTGVVTFVTAPISGHTLTWTGSYYFLNRFDSDTLSATRVFTKNNGSDLWQFDGVKMSSEFVKTSTYGKII